MPYTKADKARAIELLETESVWAAVAEIGCNHTTVYRWHADHVRSLKETPEDIAADEQRRTAMRSHLRRRLLETALAHVDRSDAARSAKDAKDYMMAAAVAVDKFRLEMGEHTDRQSHVSPIDLELERVLGEFDRQAKAQT